MFFIWDCVVNLMLRVVSAKRLYSYFEWIPTIPGIDTNSSIILQRKVSTELQRRGLPLARQEEASA